jgi:acetyl esterase/lipase
VTRLFAAALFVLSACRSTPPGPAPATESETDGAPPAVRTIPYGPSPLEFGELRLPRGAGPFPVVVFLHGGCFLAGYDKSYTVPFERALADSGFAVWSLEYRRVGNDGGGWPGTFEDAAAGTDRVRALAKEYPIDLGRVVLAGHSAGGELALWLAARRKVSPASPLHSADPLPVAGVLALVPVPDLEGLEAAGACDRALDRLLGGSPDALPDRYAAASPMRLAPIGVPSVVVLGGRDEGWSPFGRSYVARARAQGDTGLQVVEIPEATHFDVIDPKSTAWPVVLRALRGLVHG